MRFVSVRAEWHKENGETVKMITKVGRQGGSDLVAAGKEM
jgi:hypothetical protein